MIADKVNLNAFCQTFIDRQASPKCHNFLLFLCPGRPCLHVIISCLYSFWGRSHYI